MLPAGIVLIIVGVIVSFVSTGAGMLGLGIGLTLGGGLVSLGVMLAIAGAIVNAIVDHKNAVLAEMRGEREDLRIGFKSLWEELDRVRANTTPPASVPVYSATPIEPGTSRLQG